MSSQGFSDLNNESVDYMGDVIDRMETQKLSQTIQIKLVQKH